MTPAEICRRAGRRARRALHAARFHPSAPWSRGRGGYITCAGKHDRAGAQALAILSTMVFADRAGLQYVHTPFERMDFTSAADVARWEAFLNLGDGEPRITDAALSALPRLPLSSPADLPFFRHRGRVVYVARHCHAYANRFPDEYLRLRDRLRAKYAAAAQDIASRRAAGRLTVAVHVRRGDVSAGGAHADRFTPNARVRATIAAVCEAASAAGLTPALHLYSDGRPEEFADLADLGLALHLDDDAFTTFHHLAEADVLVMSKSTFSYVAALLSSGVVIYESFAGTSFHHRPLSGWLQAGRAGGVDATRLVSMLASGRHRDSA